MRANNLLVGAFLFSVFCNSVGMAASQEVQDESEVDILDYHDSSNENFTASMVRSPEYTTVSEIPKVAYDRAMAYWNAHGSEIRNKNYLTIIDFKSSANSRRMYIVNLKNKVVEKVLVAHGRDSDLNHDGYATQFSNVPGSRKSSLGFYLTAETYYGSHGLSLRLDGRSSTNSNARRRAIVMHGAWYVDPNLPVLGRSFGCPAVEVGLISRLVSQLKGGSLIYAWAGQGQ